MIRPLPAVASIVVILSALPAMAQSLGTKKPCEPWPKCILEPAPAVPVIDPGKPGDPSTPGIRQMRIPDKNAPRTIESAR